MDRRSTGNAGVRSHREGVAVTSIELHAYPADSIRSLTGANIVHWQSNIGTLLPPNGLFVGKFLDGISVNRSHPLSVKGTIAMDLIIRNMLLKLSYLESEPNGRFHTKSSDRNRKEYVASSEDFPRASFGHYPR